MSLLKAALLEDSMTLLQDLKLELEDTGFVQVVAWATGAQEFLEKVRTAQPDILLLDVDLNGDAMNGLDVAAKLRLPVLFVSGKMREYYEGVASLNAELKEVPVQYITKPVTADKLNAVLPKFIQEVRAMAKPRGITLTLKDEGKKSFALNSIVYLCADKETGSASNNKEIHFIDRKPAVLVDFSFTAMEEKGLPKEQFLTAHKSFRVNAVHIEGRVGDDLVVKAMNAEGKVVEKRLPVSENYRPAVRERFR
ncbi:MAG: response regulator [Flavobacteriales bacterium]|nr:response regulator [Flavobacteriales bacterium]MBL7956469.1 response regulator [Flavobacteriales bacterium]